jgi:predicted CXXCH cytochrome family protein
VECKKCHFENKSNTVPFIQYKNTKMLCVSCHH